MKKLFMVLVFALTSATHASAAPVSEILLRDVICSNESRVVTIAQDLSQAEVREQGSIRTIPVQYLYSSGGNGQILVLKLVGIDDLHEDTSIWNLHALETGGVEGRRVRQIGYSNIVLENFVCAYSDPSRVEVIHQDGKVKIKLTDFNSRLRQIDGAATEIFEALDRSHFAASIPSKRNQRQGTNVFAERMPDTYVVLTLDPAKSRFHVVSSAHETEVRIYGEAAYELFGHMKSAGFHTVSTTTITTFRGERITCSLSRFRSGQPSCVISQPK